MNALKRNRIKRREQLIYGRSYDKRNYSHCGVSHFEEISVETAKQLLAEGFLDPNENQNGSPTAKEMIDFACAGTDEWIWFFYGYTVAPFRDDCRVAFEGMGAYVLPTPSRLEAFLRMHSKNAYILVEQEGMACWCWYD